jgi:lysozyme
VDMRFNLGAGGFRTFQRMIRAIHNGDWDRAAMEALDSAWAEQVQDSRVDKIFVQLRDG